MSDYDSLDVDTPADLLIAEQRLSKRATEK